MGGGEIHGDSRRPVAVADGMEVCWCNVCSWIGMEVGAWCGGLGELLLGDSKESYCVNIFKL